jgi:hypothetical protein
MAAGLTKVQFAGQTFLNQDEAGVREKLKTFLKLPVLKGLGGEFDKLTEDVQVAILDEIMMGCGSSLAIATRPQCGNLRDLLQTLTDVLLEKLQAGAAAAAVATPVTTATLTTTTAVPAAAVVTPVAAGAAPAAVVAPITGAAGATMPAVVPAAGAAPVAVSATTAVATVPAVVAPPAPATPVAADAACPIPVEITSGWVNTTVERVNFPPLNEAGNYYEFQNDSSSCGRRALNNLLGGKVYDASTAVYDSGATYALDNVTQVIYPIDLHQLCHTLVPDISNARISTNETYCRRNEWHDINLLIAALQMAGYTATVQQTDILKNPTSPDHANATAELLCTPANTTLVGYVINHGKSHWVAVKKIGDAYHYFDSMTPNRTTSSQAIYTKDMFLAYLREPRVVQIVKVLYPDGSTYIDPRQLLRTKSVPATLVQAEAANVQAIENLKEDSLQRLETLAAMFEEGSQERVAYQTLQPIFVKAIRFTSDPAQDITFHEILQERPETIERVLLNRSAQEILHGLRVENGNYSENVLAVLRGREEGVPDGKGPLLFTIRVPLSLLVSE